MGHLGIQALESTRSPGWVASVCVQGPAASVWAGRGRCASRVAASAFAGRLRDTAGLRGPNPSSRMQTAPLNDGNICLPVRLSLELHVHIPFLLVLTRTSPSLHPYAHIPLPPAANMLLHPSHAHPLLPPPCPPQPTCLRMWTPRRVLYTHIPVSLSVHARPFSLSDHTRPLLPCPPPPRSQHV